MSVDNIRLRAADTIRVLSADMVQKANSGHPGMPMGCADFALVLWSKFLRHDPSDPEWIGRDRYVQSAGHGSPLLYSLLHLFGYPLPMEELQNFRQWGSRTPGHPEFGHTPGVEVTTGPLGTGFGSAVGMAIGAKQRAAALENPELFDQRIFVICGDGCMMEGVTHEAASLAAHQRLDNLVVFYDSNSITIEGSTDLAFSEDVGKRFEAYGWKVLHINAQDQDACERALADATADEVERPVLVVGTTTIGHGAPTLAGQHKTHGAPLGEDEVAGLKKALGFPQEKDFHVPAEVRTYFESLRTDLESRAAVWNARLTDFRESFPDKGELLDSLLERRVPADIAQRLLAAVPAKDMATRASGGALIQTVAQLVPALTGGAADLNPSTKTHLTEFADFTPDARYGRNIHFGVREFGMGVAANGLALYGGAIPFTATFLVFSDFMKPALRLAALQGLNVVAVFTHDSIFVGEDGPTHQPVEQVMMLRGIPGLTVIRPAESNEVAQAWACALRADGPIALCLTRQTVPNFSGSELERMDVSRGAWVVSEDPDFEAILIATGSEVGAVAAAADLLRRQGRRVRVVSMPSWELFDAQEESYREAVLPQTCRRRVTVEAGITMGWERYAGLDGLRIGIDHFGHSAPYKLLASEYGLTPESLAARCLEYLQG